MKQHTYYKKIFIYFLSIFIFSFVHSIVSAQYSDPPTATPRPVTNPTTPPGSGLTPTRPGGGTGPTTPPPPPVCNPSYQGPYCDCNGNTAYTYRRQYPYVCTDYPEFDYTNITNCGTYTCDDSGYSSCTCRPPAGQTPTPTPPPLVTPSFTITPPVTPTPSTVTVTPPPTCEQKYGSFVACGVCHDYARPWNPAGTGSCTDHGDGCCQGQPGPSGPPVGCYVGSACTSSAECDGGVCNGGACQTCSAPPPDCIVGNVSCSRFIVGKSTDRYSDTITQQKSAVAEHSGQPIPQIVLEEGDVLFTRGNIWSDQNYEKSFEVSPGGGTCYERANGSDDANPPVNGGNGYEYCRNLKGISDFDVDVIDGNKNVNVREIYTQNKHRRIFRQTGNYNLLFSQQTCRGNDNSDNKCIVNIQINPLACRPQYCEQLGKCGGSTGLDCNLPAGNCLNVEGQLALSRQEFIAEIVNYHVKVLGDWTLVTNRPGNQRHFQDVCPTGYDEQNPDGSERCETRAYYNEIETAASYGFLTPMWNGLSNYGNSGYANIRPIMKAEDDWLRDFHGVGVGGDWNGPYTNTGNNRLTLSLLRRLMFDYGMSKTPKDWTCGSTNHEIKGYVYIDTNKNGRRDAGELPYKGDFSVTHGISGAILAINDGATGDGTFSITGAPASSTGYNIRVTLDGGLPDGYQVVYPQNGVGFNYLVKPGTPCNPQAITPATIPGLSGDGSCDPATGNIINLNYGITESNPWMQFTGLDVRVDQGFSSVNRPPKTVANTCTDANITGNTGYTAISAYR